MRVWPHSHDRRLVSQAYRSAWPLTPRELDFVEALLEHRRPR